MSDAAQQGEAEYGDPEAEPSLPSATLLSRTLRAAPAPDPSPVPRFRGSSELVSLAWPAMVSQLVVMTVSAVDVAMVGRLSAEHVAAVGFASQLYNLSQAMLLAVGLAGLAVVARASGAGDAARARRALVSALQLSMGLASLLIALITGFGGTVLEGLGAEPAVLGLARPYLALLIASLAPLSVCLVLELGLRAEKNPRAPLWVAGSVAAAKLALNGPLIFGLLGFPRLELVGAGIATLVAQLLGLTCFAALVARAPAASALRLRASDLRGDTAVLGRIVQIALPGVGERFVMNAALLMYFRLLSEYGSLAIAAYTIGIRFVSFTWIPGTGFGSAASTLVGQALGANRPLEGSRAGWLALRLALGVAIGMALVCVLRAQALASLFSDDPALVSELAGLIVALGLMQPFLQAQFALGGAHRGAGDSWTPFVASSVGSCAVRVPLAAAAGLGLGTDIRWLWGALVLDHVVRASWLWLSFRRAKWMRS